MGGPTGPADPTGDHTAVIRLTAANNIPILVGAALIREREHGTRAHLLVMLLTALGIWLTREDPMKILGRGGPSLG